MTTNTTFTLGHLGDTLRWLGRADVRVQVLCKMFHVAGGPCWKPIRPHIPECAGVDAAGLISTRTLVT
jgi:hypothetical protein